MAIERATVGNPFWKRRFGVFPTPGLKYLQWRHRQCVPYVRNKDILDVPSGEGLGLSYFNSARSVTCLDYNKEAVESTRSKSKKVVAAVCGSMMELPFGDDSFDCVVSLEGLEHVDKRDGAVFLSEVYRVLRPEGLLLLSCPLIENGLHSGNEFHLHEWTWTDLRQLLDAGFTLNVEEHSNTIGPVVFCVLRKRGDIQSANEILMAFDGNSKRCLGESIKRTSKWIRSCRTSNGFSLEVNGKAGLLPTCFAVLAAEALGDDEVLESQDVRQAVATHIQAHQDQVSGLFVPGQLKRGALSSHSATYIRLQCTYFAIHALDALDATPLESIPYTERFIDISYLKGWLDGGPWNNPWLHSNNVMFAFALLEHEYRTTGNGNAVTAFDSILDYLDERQDAQTGLWQPDDEADVVNSVYAAYHFFPYYFWRHRLPKYVERIIDSTLSIQEPGGFYGKNGGACEDLDAVHTLVMMSLTTDYRNEDIRRSLERFYWRLLQIQNLDGGFPNYCRALDEPGWKRRLAKALGVEAWLEQRYRITRTVPTWRYSGWSELQCAISASDMWSAWFRPLSLRLIADRYPDLVDGELPGKFRRLPGLGWHNPYDIKNARPVALRQERTDHGHVEASMRVT